MNNKNKTRILELIEERNFIKSKKWMLYKVMLWPIIVVFIMLLIGLKMSKVKTFKISIFPQSLILNVETKYIILLFAIIWITLFLCSYWKERKIDEEITFIINTLNLEKDVESFFYRLFEELKQFNFNNDNYLPIDPMNILSLKNFNNIEDIFKTKTSTNKEYYNYNKFKENAQIQYYSFVQLILFKQFKASIKWVKAETLYFLKYSSFLIINLLILTINHISLFTLVLLFIINIIINKRINMNKKGKFINETKAERELLKRIDEILAYNIKNYDIEIIKDEINMLLDIELNIINLKQSMIKEEKKLNCLICKSKRLKSIKNWDLEKNNEYILIEKKINNSKPVLLRQKELLKKLEDLYQNYFDKLKEKIEENKELNKEKIIFKIDEIDIENKDNEKLLENKENKIELFLEKEKIKKELNEQY